ncbi:iron transporter [Dyella jejuensis]|uniref:Iron transporter n=1 Tax=Dyella jejuensis TaxID=1432009 RepID=A0ABW8JK73_9GAMM
MPDLPFRSPKLPQAWFIRNRVAIATRVLAALCGGYFVAYACTALLTVVLPMDRINRVVTANLLSFVVWCAAAIWVFAARSAWRSWWPLLLAGAAMLGVALVFRGTGMRP